MAPAPGRMPGRLFSPALAATPARVRQLLRAGDVLLSLPDKAEILCPCCGHVMIFSTPCAPAPGPRPSSRCHREAPAPSPFPHEAVTGKSKFRPANPDAIKIRQARLWRIMPRSRGFCAMALEIQAQPLLPGTNRARSRSRDGDQSPLNPVQPEPMEAKTEF